MTLPSNLDGSLNTGAVFFTIFPRFVIRTHHDPGAHETVVKFNKM
jgi:hypothetical protein